MSKIQVVDCYKTDCPCLNNDCEDGCTCNLGYDVEYFDCGNILGYTCISKNCKLNFVCSENKHIKPEKIEIEYPTNIRLTHYEMEQSLIKTAFNKVLYRQAISKNIFNDIKDLPFKSVKLE